MRMLIAATLASMAIAPMASAASNSGETALTRLVAGREAGRPVDCLTLRNVRSSRILDRTAILFESGGTLYLNRPSAGAELLAADKAIVTKSIVGQICSGEAVQLFDAASGVQSGSVFLGKFVPYRKQLRSPGAPSAPTNGY
jgi:hypothetical protein